MSDVITEDHLVFCTLLRDLMYQGCYAKVIWGGCQWDSRDADEDSLFQMFRDKGLPGSIEFCQE